MKPYLVPAGFFGQIRCCCCTWWHATDGKAYFLPPVTLKAHATIISTTTHTVLEQTFSNPNTEPIPRCHYNFPLYAGVSVIGFECRINDDRVLHGVVAEREKAKQTFQAAIDSGETAGLLDQDVKASDVFRIALGNVPARATVTVRIEFVGELKHDSESEGIRYTLPTHIAPRYGYADAQSLTTSSLPAIDGSSMEITVDVDFADGAPVKSIECTSHAVSISIGTLSTQPEADPVLTRGSATLSSKTTALDKDFVLLIKSKHIETPRAILERHPSIPNQRALMTTLVPRFSLPQIRPEIVFIADRSGSMEGTMHLLISALEVFLKSLPQGVKFNICSFGSCHETMWEKSVDYTEQTLKEAVMQIKRWTANFGGTETLQAIKHVVKQRFSDLPLEMILLTDGDIWQQEEAFTFLRGAVEQSKSQIRLFALGIGSGVSHSMIEGLARAGDGFAQAVQDNERMDNKVVRMLKGALSPHIFDYSLEVQYGADAGVELIDNVRPRLQELVVDEPWDVSTKQIGKPTISLFDTSTNPDSSVEGSPAADLPQIPIPSLLQVPAKIPSLYAFNRTTVYLLLAPSTIQRNPIAVILRANSAHGTLELRIPVTVSDEPGRTFHSLAARRAAEELEEGSLGWLKYVTAKPSNKALSEIYPSKISKIVQREAIRLGETFGVVNRWCSFVAVKAPSLQAALEKQRTHAGKPPPKGMDEKPQDDSKSDESSSLGSFEMVLDEDIINPPEDNSAYVTRISSPRVRSLGGKLSSPYGAVPPPPPRAVPPPFGAVPLPPGAAPRVGGSFGASPGNWAPQAFPDGRLSALPSAPAPKPAKKSGGLFQPASSGFGGLFGGGVNRGAPSELKLVKRKAASASSAKPQLPLTKNMNVDVKEGGQSDTSGDIVRRLIGLQEFDGRWIFSPGIVQELCIDSNILKQGGDTLCTAVVIVFLEQRMKSEEDVWEMVVDKARDWLKAQGSSAEALNKAETLLKR